MTKEEYTNYLQTDYWRGYSYALIKERGFMCQDCGKVFWNQRNLLNVHHLRYYNTAPWSYEPDAVIVLCKPCHEARHKLDCQSRPPRYLPSYLRTLLPPKEITTIIKEPSLDNYVPKDKFNQLEQSYNNLKLTLDKMEKNQFRIETKYEDLKGRYSDLLKRKLKTLTNTKTVIPKPNDYGGWIWLMLGIFGLGCLLFFMLGGGLS